LLAYPDPYTQVTAGCPYLFQIRRSNNGSSLFNPVVPVAQARTGRCYAFTTESRGAAARFGSSSLALETSLMHDATARGPGAWFNLPNRQGALTLFCFPHAGGTGSSYHALGRALAPYDIAVCPAQLPGRERRLNEVPFRSALPLATALAAAITHTADGPFALFGHSMGALLAFEVAHALRQRGLEPMHLFASASRPPQLRHWDTWLHDLPDLDFVEAVGLRYGGIPAELFKQPELMALVRPALRADIALVETYECRHTRPLDCEISAYGAGSDRHVAVDILRGWREVSLGQFHMRVFEGDHFYLHERPTDVAEAIANRLNAALR
jgi:surfactin synthase thioesterase subunit